MTPAEIKALIAERNAFQDQAGRRKRENAALRNSLMEIIKVLGPSAPDCKGCSTEIAEALRIAREAVK